MVQSLNQAKTTDGHGMSTMASHLRHIDHCTTQEETGNHHKTPEPVVPLTYQHPSFTLFALISYLLLPL